MLANDFEDRKLFIGRLVVLVEQNRRLLMVLVAVHAYDRHIGEVPNLEAFFAKSLQRIRESSPSQTRAITNQTLDTLIRCAFAAVVGATLLDEWIFPGGFRNERAKSAAFSHFIERGLYGQEPASEGSA